MKTKLNVLIIALLMLFAACNSTDNNEAETAEIPGIHKVVVKEVAQANSYTYLNVEENGKTFWIAVSKMMASPGETYFYTGGMEMQNFESKDLGKVFESLVLVENLSATQSPTPETKQAEQPVRKGNERKEVSIEPIEGGVSIAEIYSNPKQYIEQQILVHGEVVKVNNGIMGKNWVHIQDGTEADGEFDLTITTNDMVSVGDVVTFSGVLALNKDFGAGYVYDVIMEDATQPEIR